MKFKRSSIRNLVKEIIRNNKNNDLKLEGKSRHNDGGWNIIKKSDLALIILQAHKFFRDIDGPFNKDIESRPREFYYSLHGFINYPMLVKKKIDDWCIENYGHDCDNYEDFVEEGYGYLVLDITYDRRERIFEVDMSLNNTNSNRSFVQIPTIKIERNKLASITEQSYEVLEYAIKYAIRGFEELFEIEYLMPEQDIML